MKCSVAAVAATFLALLKAGDHLIISDVCYAGAYELATRILPGLGIEVTPVNLSRLDAVKAALRPNTRLIHAESPCNPLLRLTDLAGRFAAFASGTRDSDSQVVIDNLAAELDAVLAAFGLSFPDLDEEDWELVSRYLTGNQLLLDCLKQAAVPDREAIKDRLLLLPDA